MLQWTNPSHPRTMQAAVILGYLTGVFALLGFGQRIWLFPLALAIGGGAFGMANNKRIGWIALSIGSALYALIKCLDILIALPSINPTLMAINALIFPGALVAAVLHPNTREYMKAWFE